MPAHSLISIAMAIGFRVAIFVGTLSALQDLAESTFFGLRLISLRLSSGGLVDSAQYSSQAMYWRTNMDKVSRRTFVTTMGVVSGYTGCCHHRR
jgi:hypothetical protein